MFTQVEKLNIESITDYREYDNWSTDGATALIS